MGKTFCIDDTLALLLLFSFLNNILRGVVVEQIAFSVVVI